MATWPQPFDTMPDLRDANLRGSWLSPRTTGGRDAGPDAMPHASLRLARLADAEPEAGKGALEAVAARLGLDGELPL